MVNSGIPLWFRCFKGTNDSDAFKISLFTKGIWFVHNLFSSKKCNLIFLADRWFPFIDIMQFIDSLGDTYCIRAKSNTLIKFNDPSNYYSHVSSLSDIKPCITHAKHFSNVLITEKQFKTNLAVSNSQNHKEPFYIFTNGKTTDAIKHYGYRFGSIEFIFKNQKSNGFYLESTKMRNLHSFSTLFGIACIALLWLTILGANYSKNSNSTKSFYKFRSSKRKGSSSKRILSLFNTRLDVF